MGESCCFALFLSRLSQRDVGMACDVGNCVDRVFVVRVFVGDSSKAVVISKGIVVAEEATDGMIWFVLDNLRLLRIRPLELGRVLRWLVLPSLLIAVH